MAKSEEKEGKERVTIFGKDERHWERQWRGRGDKTWGFLFIGAGIILIMNTIGTLSWSVWDRIWKFWPVLFIIWGVQIILGSSHVGRALANISAFIFIGLVILFAIHEVDASIVSWLPVEFNQVFSAMKGVR